MRNRARWAVAGGLMTLLAGTCAADEIKNAYEQCRSGQLAPGLYYLTPNEKKIDLPERGSVTLPYSAQGKLLVVPELEDDEEEAAWGLTIRTELERRDTQDEVNLSRTQAKGKCARRNYGSDHVIAWDDDTKNSKVVPYDDYENNNGDPRYGAGASADLMKKWHFNVRRQKRCADTRRLSLSYQESKVGARAILGDGAVIGGQKLKKPPGARLTSALVFRSKGFKGCHSMWVSKFGGTSSEKPINSTVSVSALRSTQRTKHPSMSLKITWKVD